MSERWACGRRAGEDSIVAGALLARAHWDPLLALQADVYRSADEKELLQGLRYWSSSGGAGVPSILVVSVAFGRFSFLPEGFPTLLDLF